MRRLRTSFGDSCKLTYAIHSITLEYPWNTKEYPLFTMVYPWISPLSYIYYLFLNITTVN